MPLRLRRRLRRRHQLPPQRQTRARRLTKSARDRRSEVLSPTGDVKSTASGPGSSRKTSGTLQNGEPSLGNEFQIRSLNPVRRQVTASIVASKLFVTGCARQPRALEASVMAAGNFGPWDALRALRVRFAAKRTLSEAFSHSIFSLKNRRMSCPFRKAHLLHCEIHRPRDCLFQQRSAKG